MQSKEIIWCTLVLLLAGCVNLAQYPVTTDNYTIRAGEIFNPDYCAIFFSGTDTEGEQTVNFGLNLKALDADSNMLLPAPWGRISYGEGGYEVIALSTFPWCIQKLPTTSIELMVFADGYTIKTFPFELPVNQIITLEVPLRKKCSINSYDQENAEKYLSFMESEFGIPGEQINFTCMEGFFPSRGIEMVMKGEYEGTGFEAGSAGFSASSGGSSSFCFATEGNELFAAVKEYVCNNPSYDVHPGFAEDCSDGVFEYTEGDRQTLSISIRYGQNGMVTRGDAECIR